MAKSSKFLRYAYGIIGEFMKKIMVLFLLLVPIKVLAFGSAYIVMDMDSGRVLEGENLDKQYLIASTTKILTAITAIEYGNLEDVVEIDDSIIESFGSGIYVSIGERIVLDDLLYGLLLRSGNDAALAIAKHVGGSKESFVFLMNEIAKKIGMDNSIFVNPSGLEERDGTGNLSTVYDMAILMKYAMSNEHFRRITGTKDIVIKTDIKTYKWSNKNKLLDIYPYCTGGKTGYTKKAKRTLVTSASKDNMNMIVVTFKDGNDFLDHKSLYEKYFNEYESVTVLSKDKEYGDNLRINSDYKVMVKDTDDIKIKIDNDGSNSPLNGSKVGIVRVYLNGEEIGYRNLYYHKESITSNRSFLSKLWNFLNRW